MEQSCRAGKNLAVIQRASFSNDARSKPMMPGLSGRHWKMTAAQINFRILFFRKMQSRWKWNENQNKFQVNNGKFVHGSYFAVPTWLLDLTNLANADQVGSILNKQAGCSAAKKRKQKKSDRRTEVRPCKIVIHLQCLGRHRKVMPSGMIFLWRPRHCKWMSQSFALQN